MNKRILAPLLPVLAGMVCFSVAPTQEAQAASRVKFTFENVLTQQNAAIRAPVKKKKVFIFLAKKAKVSAPKNATVTGSGKVVINGASIPWKTYSGISKSFLGDIADSRCLALPTYSLIAAVGVPDLCVSGVDRKVGDAGLQLGSFGLAGQAWTDSEFGGKQVYFGIGRAGKVSGLSLVSVDGSLLPVTPLSLPGESELQAWWTIAPVGARFDRLWTVDGKEEREAAPTVAEVPGIATNANWTEGLTEIQTGNVLGEVQWVTARAGSEFKVGIFYAKTPTLDTNYAPDLFRSLVDENGRKDSKEFEYGVGGTGMQFNGRIKDVSSHLIAVSLGATSVEFLGLPPKAKGVAKLVSLGPDASRLFCPVVVYDYRGPYTLVAKNAAGVEVARFEN
jgi:hypothetical protein